MTGPPRCLVFGGSGALGRAVCEALAREGARVAFTYNRGETRAQELLPGLEGGIALRLDLSSVTAIEAAVDEVASAFGGIDAFVQCAAVAVTGEAGASRSHQRMPDVDEAGWQHLMDVNVRSTFFAVRRVAEVMGRDGGGNVVLIGSIDGVKPAPAPVHYAASKGALAAMTGAMAKELGAKGVRVNLVAPGILEAGLSRDIPEDLLQEYLKHCGLERVGRLEEIAGLVAWLARCNTYVNGQTIVVDGAL
jgi:NAD(P)-dependent dehydrogenase (short-subunit alcohol dehydrogenase family)